MPRRIPLLLAAVLVATAAALAATAAAQGAPALQYDIVQADTTLGSFGMTVTSTDGGTRASSTLDLGAAMELTDRLQTDADGNATGYHLEGTARGASVTIDVRFEDGKAVETIAQGGSTSTVSVDLPGPVAVIDNSFLDGWQVAAARVRGDAPVTFDILVPQAARTGSLTLTPAGEETLDLPGGSVQARRIDGLLKVAGQTVGVSLWLDDAGALARFAQPSAALTYRRVAAGAAAGPQTPAPAASPEAEALQRHLQEQSACVQERQVTTASTGETLAGALTVPQGSAAGAAGRAPVLLLLPGSGAVDMNGNEPPVLTNGMYRQLAYALGCDGYAVLRVNKLGIPPSTGDGNAVTIDTYAQNTADWLAFLRAQPDVDPRRVGLAGHSEGGLIALYAVATGKADAAAVVLLASPGLPFDQVVLDQMALQARLRGVQQAEIDANQKLAREAFDAVAASSGTRLELSGDLAANPIAQAFAHAAGLLRSEMAQDPARLAARAAQRGVPVLIVQGAKDVQVDLANGAALHAAAPGATYLVFPDLTHNLTSVAGPAIEGAVPGPGARLSDALASALGTWLAGNLRTAGVGAPAAR